MFDWLLKETEKMKRVTWAEKMKFELGLLKDKFSSIGRNETEKVILGIGSEVRITKEEGDRTIRGTSLGLESRASESGSRR